jgi:Scramblase
VYFSIENDKGEKVADLNKKSPGCVKSMIGDADVFTIEFPKDADEKERAILMCSTLFLDYRYFEDNKKRQAGYYPPGGIH